MKKIEIEGKTLTVDQDGHLADPREWSQFLADGLARGEGILQLTEKHWTVINYMRKVYQAEGAPPSIRRITQESGVETKDLYHLFPGGPAKKAAKIAGLPKPKSCL